MILPLVNSNKSTLIDPEFQNKCLKYKWKIDTHGYVYAYFPEQQRNIHLHRFIIGAGKNQIVDHIDRNPLNNRLNNLRFCSRSGNSTNSKKQNNRSSKFKGVTHRKGNWEAVIMVDGKFKYIGLFKTEIDAAHAYDNEARILHREFAFLNFPEEFQNPIPIKWSSSDEKLLKLFSPETKEECWLWKGNIHNGKARFTYGDKQTTGQKAVYTYYGHLFKSGMVLTNTCRNKLCVNPNHLCFTKNGKI